MRAAEVSPSDALLSPAAPGCHTLSLAASLDTSDSPWRRAMSTAERGSPSASGCSCHLRRPPSLPSDRQASTVDEKQGFGFSPHFWDQAAAASHVVGVGQVSDVKDDVGIVGGEVVAGLSRVGRLADIGDQADADGVLLGARRLGFLRAHRDQPWIDRSDSHVGHSSQRTSSSNAYASRAAASVHQITTDPNGSVLNLMGADQADPGLDDATS